VDRGQPAAVLPMTLVAGLVAALLAIGEPGLDWRWLLLGDPRHHAGPPGQQPE